MNKIYNTKKEITTNLRKFLKEASSLFKTQLTTYKNINGKKVRVESLFNTVLTLFKIAFNSLKYVKISYKFILYDI